MRLKLLICVALLAGAFAAPPAHPVTPEPVGDAPVATIRPLEVRTRKLHLVRPDLLRYPMQYDVYC